MRKFLQIAAAILMIQTLMGEGYGIVEFNEKFVDGMPLVTLQEIKEKIERKVTCLYVGTYEDWVILSDTEGCSELIDEGYYPIPNYCKIPKETVIIPEEKELEVGLGLWGPVGTKIESIDLKRLKITTANKTAERNA